MLPALNIANNRPWRDICECESGADTEKRNEETERKSGVIVIKARTEMKGRNA